MARIIIHTSEKGVIFEDETVWDKVLDIEFVNLQIEVRDDADSIIQFTTLHDHDVRAHTP